MPVRLPRGTVVTVGVAPVLASAILGGPLAGAIVAAIGTTDTREVKGQIPWYGTLFNHASVVVSAVAAGIAFEISSGLLSEGTPGAPGAGSFIGAAVAGVAFYLVNSSLAIAAVSARTGSAARTIWAQDVAGVAISLIGLVPLAWLMAQVFQMPNGVGWWATALFAVPLLTTRLAYARYVETRELFEQTIEALSKAVDARDNYTRNHSSRVSHIAEAMARVMRLPESDIEILTWAGLLHDIGKIGIRDNILLKEGPLDKSERILMNQHPTIGAEIVAPASQLSREAPLIKAHHEWFNGSGYPDGVEALDIPLGARILTIADAYEAMTSSRPYRKIPLTHEQAVDQLEKFTGIQFDPEIVPVLINLDRTILDRPPDRPDELPTMLNIPYPRDFDRRDRRVGDKPPPELNARPAVAS
ncbi:MAG TPA: HD-GYP domain-containing protein, partial [Candidatus Limnocylindrales bacterium]|nr:HD-GYP domain-containing protein [Candidatus Limnocylindrales bacterium]